MKKFLVFAGLIGISQIVSAAVPEQPWLTYPENGATLPTNLPAFFSWANTKGVNISSYRIVISTDATFSGYNQKTKSCSNTASCFTDTTNKTNYALRQTGTILKNDTNYYWHVEAINASGSSVFDVREFAYGAPTTPIDTVYTVVSPKVTGVTTDVSSISAGNPIKISATFDGALPAGYNAKVDYGNGLLTMTPSATGADYSATPTKSATYSVGIYDDKNILKSNKLTGRFTVTAATTTGTGGTASGTAPVLTLISDTKSISSVVQGAVYTIQLSATDVDANLKQITIDWGDGSSDAVNVDDGVTRSLTHVYSTTGSFTWTATAYDSGNLASNVVTQAVTVSAPVPVVVTNPVTTPTPPKVISYSAINNSGSQTTSARDWKCTLDSTNNLMWEVKTDDNYLHDKDWTYSWFEADTVKNGGYSGTENGGRCKGLVKCNTAAFIQAVNAEKLCGKDTWRLPTKKELENLVVCPNGLTPNRSDNEISDICIGTNPPLNPYSHPSTPFIDTVYFPNTQTDWYWTSDTYIPTVSSTAKPLTSKQKKPIYDSAWNVSFYDSHVRPDHKANAAAIRLVSD